MQTLCFLLLFALGCLGFAAIVLAFEYIGAWLDQWCAWCITSAPKDSQD